MVWTQYGQTSLYYNLIEQLTGADLLPQSVTKLKLAVTYDSTAVADGLYIVEVANVVNGFKLAAVSKIESGKTYTTILSALKGSQPIAELSLYFALKPAQNKTPDDANVQFTLTPVVSQYNQIEYVVYSSGTKSAGTLDFDENGLLAVPTLGEAYSDTDLAVVLSNAEISNVVNVEAPSDTDLNKWVTDTENGLGAVASFKAAELFGGLAVKKPTNVSNMLVYRVK